MIKKILVIISIGLLIVACQKKTTETITDDVINDDLVVVSSEGLDGSSMFTASDKNSDDHNTDVTTITLSDSGSKSNNSKVVINSDTITITSSGTYYLEGELSDGQVIVDAAIEDKVQLVFNNVSIINSNSAPLYVREADKVFISLKSGTTNFLKNIGNYVLTDDNNVDAVIFSKADLSINGQGSLTVESKFGNGITSKDDLVIYQSPIIIDVSGHGLDANNSVRLLETSLEIISEKDGIKAEHESDLSLGFIYMKATNLKIQALGDGLSASSILQVESGEYSVIAGSQSNLETSGKGLKSGSNLILKNGSYVIEAYDDALHSNGDITISDGSYQLESQDDGVHAENTLLITGGKLDILNSYEGLEAFQIKLNGGNISVVALDDGINASEGDTTSLSGSPIIEINGGIITIIASGDGVDSNGSILMTGGELYVSQDGAGDSPLDYETSAEIQGGILIVTGRGEMAQNFSSASQGIALLSVNNQNAGTTIYIPESEVEFTPTKSFNSILVSTPDFSLNNTYEVKVGASSQSLKFTELILGGMASPGGMQGAGGMGGPRHP